MSAPIPSMEYWTQKILEDLHQRCLNELARLHGVGGIGPGRPKRVVAEDLMERKLPKGVGDMNLEDEEETDIIEEKEIEEKSQVAFELKPFEDAVTIAERKRDDAKNELDKKDDKIEALREKIENWPNFVTLTEEEKSFWTSEKDQAANLKLKNERNARNLSHAERSLDDLLVEKHELVETHRDARIQLKKAQDDLETKKAELTKEAKEAEPPFKRINTVVGLINIKSCDQNSPLCSFLRAQLDGFGGSVECIQTVFENDLELPFCSEIEEILKCAQIDLHDYRRYHGRAEMPITGFMRNIFPIMHLNQYAGNILPLEEFGNQHEQTQTTMTEKKSPDMIILLNGIILIKREDKASQDGESDAMIQLETQSEIPQIIEPFQFMFAQTACGPVVKTGILVPLIDGATCRWEFRLLREVNINLGNVSEVAYTFVLDAIRVFKCMIFFYQLSKEFTPPIKWYFEKTLSHRDPKSFQKRPTVVVGHGDHVAKKTSFYNGFIQEESDDLVKVVNESEFCVSIFNRHINKKGELELKIRPVGRALSLTSPEECKIALLCILKALHHLHQHNWAHTDIRSTNVLSTMGLNGWKPYLLMDFEHAVKNPPSGLFVKDIEMAVSNIAAKYSYELSSSLLRHVKGKSAHEAINVIESLEF
eukprot:TRINITY_DN16_c0_g1_i1.p1 TRINITY_DN16_c0_g1~~TRINITY_DN16_c0_g1_i1.p1  ORF type:complete len:649 (-),score=145.15 TRINITY_DN16_c0_g1_i1:142-2088(-)